MKDITYSIEDFIYNSTNRTLYANENELYPIQGDYKIPFPNQKRQFYILNIKTNNKRRFRYIKQYKSLNNIIFQFQSEDDIICIISKN